MKTKNIPLFSDELLDQILADDTLGGDWSPVQNKLDALKGALMERMLRGEMTHHLGYPAGEGPRLRPRIDVTGPARKRCRPKAGR